MRSAHVALLVFAIALVTSWRYGVRASRALSERGEAFRGERGWLPKNAGPEFFTPEGWRARRRMHAWAWSGFAAALGVLALGAIFRW